MKGDGAYRTANMRVGLKLFSGCNVFCFPVSPLLPPLTNCSFVMASDSSCLLSNSEYKRLRLLVRDCKPVFFETGEGCVKVYDQRPGALFATKTGSILMTMFQHQMVWTRTQ